MTGNNIRQMSAGAGMLHQPYAAVTAYRQGNRELIHGKGIFGTPLKIAGKEYEYGFGTHAASVIKVAFSHPVVHIRAVAGMEDCRYTRNSKRYVCPMRFSIHGNGKELAASAPLTVDDVHIFDLDLPHLDSLELHIGIEGKLSNHFANWANIEATTADGRIIKIGQPGILNKMPIDFEYDGIPAQQWFTRKGITHTEEKFADHTLHTYSCNMDGMIAEVKLKAFHDFPVWEWHTTFTNTTKENSKQLRKVRSASVILYPETIPHFTPLNVKRLLGSFHLPGGGANSFRNSFIPVQDELPDNAVVQSRCINGRSSESFLPVVDIGNDEENLRLVVGWSGQWFSDVRNFASGRELVAGMEYLDLYLTPGESVEIPSSFLQYNSAGGNEAAINLWRRFVMTHLTPRINGKMPKLPISAMHWGGMGEKEHLRRLEHLVKMKVPFDIYWIDAGWYTENSDNGDEATDTWRKNVGDWDFDPENFPEEMKNISAAAHRHGKDFLVWFEPERVINDRNIAKQHPEYLIFLDGEYETLLNLGHPEAWQWCFNKLSSIIERNHIDWFREDFNFEPLPYWRKADPPGRTGITEIKFMAGLYKLWRELRKKHPNLKIDNCASGGRRLDPELLRYSYPLAYSDMMCEMEFDADYSLTHINGLARFWPIFGAGLQKRFAPDTYLFRSVMSSTMAVRCLYNAANDVDNGYPYEWLNEQLAQYKEIQHFFTKDFYPVLEPQGKAVALWTAFQYDAPETGDGMMLVFRTENSPVIESTVKFKALDPAASYKVWDMDNTFAPFEITGRELLEKGLTLHLEQPRTARIIRYHKQ